MAKRGETREVILRAATKVFFKNGFEKTTVKMILGEADIVTGSFYHFFPSKEALFEAVVEKFLKDYSSRLRMILEDDTLTIEQIIDGFFREFARSSETYFNVLQADKLHWTIKCALHEMIVESMTDPLVHALSRLIQDGSVKSTINVDSETLARILIKGSEAVVHSHINETKELNRVLMEYWKRILDF